MVAVLASHVQLSQQHLILPTHSDPSEHFFVCLFATCVDSIHFIEALSSIKKMHRSRHRTSMFWTIFAACSDPDDDGSEYEKEILFMPPRCGTRASLESHS